MPTTRQVANSTLSASAAALAAKPKAIEEVVAWELADYLPAVYALIKERWESVAKEKGFNLVFEEVPGNAASIDRHAAAVQAGTPPDLWRVFDYETQYWRIQNQTADLSDVVNPFVNQAGGYWDPVKLTATYKGAWYGMPQAVNCWPFHVRQDILNDNNLSYPKDWDEFRAQGRQLSRGQLSYYGMCLGRTNDTNNHFIGMLWTMGGKLQNEDGSLAVSKDDKAWLDTIKLVVAMYKDDRIIPPGSVNWDDGANNAGYQSEQLVLTSNPTSIYNWLRLNKPEMTAKTKFYSYPAGTAGSYGQVDVWSQAIFKNGKGGEGARMLLTAFADPTWYRDYINNKLQGRFVPVYKTMIEDDQWTKNDLYTEYKQIIDTGRIMGYGSAPLGAISELTTKYVVADIMQDVLVKQVSPEEALATFVDAAKEIYAKPENQR